MTNDEIKKAWNVFKRNMKKECADFSTGYTFVMNARQVEKRTATICLGMCFDDDFSERIKNYEDAGESGKKMLDKVRKDKERFGTRENKAKYLFKSIKDSKAFAQFNESVGGTADVTLTIQKEYLAEYYYARFTY